jgi:iron(II)-dependent oxidoreductase
VAEPGFEPHDVAIPGGVFELGGRPEEPFVFDNEKWAHPVSVAPFRIGAAPVTNGEYRAFVEAGGYRDIALWSDEGWVWRGATGLAAPATWHLDGELWTERWFDQHRRLDDDLPVVHVNWFEASAYCAFADRRLPSEAEWELAALGEPSPDGRGIAATKRRFPWGDVPTSPDRANLDAWRAGLAPVGALAAGDSAFGCRQMLGNVWEWTADTFNPYPGFVVDPYATYSVPSFGAQKVLRGGCWATRSRVARPTFRNFYTPDRHNIFAGFRTVAR